MNLTLSQELTFCQEFTDIYKQYQTAPAAVREAACLAYQLPYCACPPHAEDLFVGRFYHPFIGFSPQPNFMALGYYLDEEKAALLLKNCCSPEQAEALRRLCQYWSGENTVAKIESCYPEEIAQWLPSADYQHKRAVAYPLYRISGSQLDYKKLLTFGIKGLHEHIDNSAHNSEAESKAYYESLHSVLDTFTAVCDRFLSFLDTSLTSEANCSGQHRLTTIRASLVRIRTLPPENFFDAIQLTLIWWFMSGSLNLERMDTYLADYYVRDIEQGILCEEEALELLCGMWRMLEVRERTYDTHVMIGGKGRANPESADRFCKLAIAATQKLHTVVPQLTLRIYKGMNPEVYDQALAAIGEGCTFPMLYNDDANIPAVQSAFNLPQEEAEQYCPFGCGEYVIAHKSIGTPSGIINLAKALEITLNHGRDLETGELLGLDLGGLEDFTTFEQLLAAYRKQVTHFVRLLAVQEELEYIYASKDAAFLTFSMLYDDCISSGKPLLSGGVRYLGGTLESYGNVNTADSLTALKTLLYDKKEVTARELLKALKSNFHGNELLRQKLLACPKYGNELELADNMLLMVHDHICTTTRESASLTNLHSYLTVIINNDANTVLGHLTSAMPDGRCSGLHLANANNPQGGMDTNGLTAMLNSIVKPSIHHHAGSVQNLKLSKELFSDEKLSLTKSLLDTYFQKGGSQLMITVVSRQELEDAVINPAAHKNLIVRIGGFSARFIELAPDVQNELLSRTLF